MHITAVLLDLGGTVFGYQHRDQMRHPATVALERLGLDPTDVDVMEAKRQAFEQVEREYAVRAAFIHRDLFRDRISRTALLLGRTPSAEVLDRFDEENRQAILDHLVPQPDATSLLKGLRDRGIYTAIVSNADDDYLGPLLRRHAIDTLLDDWTSSEEARSCKPDARIYELALEKAGRPAGETLFVGDSPQHDIAGAQKAGMRTVLIGDEGAIAPLSAGLATPQAEDFRIRDLIELLEIVDRMNGES